MKRKINLSLIILLIILSIFVTGCKDTSESGESKTIRLGIASDETEVWDHIQKELEKEDIDLEIVSFGDYTRPNIALAEGEIDLNAFQHYAFFNQFKEEHNLKLTAIGETVIAPLGIYSNKIDSLDHLEEGDLVAIPNDDTNLSRSLRLLEKAELIKLDDVDIPTSKDIKENKLNLEIKELDASIIARTLDDVKLGIINSGFAVQGGLIPTEDSIFLEPIDEDSKPYINIIAAREEDKDNEILRRIVEVYQTEEVEKIINELYAGSQQKAW